MLHDLELDSPDKRLQHLVLRHGWIDLGRLVLGTDLPDVVRVGVVIDEEIEREAGQLGQGFELVEIRLRPVLLHLAFPQGDGAATNPAGASDILLA